MTWPGVNAIEADNCDNEPVLWDWVRLEESGVLNFLYGSQSPVYYSFLRNLTAKLDWLVFYKENGPRRAKAGLGSFF